MSADHCKRLAQRHITPCPAGKVIVVDVPVTNATNGAVSDRQAQEWGRAQLLTEAYFDWAVSAGADTFLDVPVKPGQPGAIADPGAAPNLYGTELSVISQAHQAHGSVVFQPLTIRRLALIAMPAAIQADARQEGLTPKPYAFVGEAVGPGSLGIKGADGREQVLFSTPAGQVQQLLVWGEFKQDPDLGAIWYEWGLFSCRDARITATCTQALG